MQPALQFVSFVVGVSLFILILSAMLRGQWRQYPFVFLYVLGDLVTTLLEVRPALKKYAASAADRKAFSQLYYWDERVMQVLLFLLVISMIYQASSHLKSRLQLVGGAIVSVLVYAGISYLVAYNPNVTTGKWMNPWLRNLNFIAAILDMGLWALLIGARKKDYKLLMISGALGIQFTAGAIGQALRYVAPAQSPVQWTGYLITLANLACLYIFWQAFRTPAEPAVPAVAQDAQERRVNK